nr:hypothetical protein [Lachnospiraceae bacterium]
FSKCPWYLRASVESLTEYAGDDLGIASAGTYDAWGAMLSAFLAATDNTDATIGNLVVGSVQDLKDGFSKEVEGSYNDKMNFTSGWFDPGGSSYDPTSGPEARKRFNRCWSVEHCTKDANGKYIGLVESYTYGVKTSERYYSSAGNGFNGLLYWKQWNVGEDNFRLNDLRDLSRNDDYNPEALDFVVPRCESEFLSSIDNNPPPNNGYTGSSQDDDGSGDELQGLQKVNVVFPHDRYRHHVIYYQKDENGSLCPKDSTRVWKDLYLELNYDAYEELAREYEEEYEADVQSFDLMYGNQAWEVKEQRVYDVEGFMTREFYYVGTMPDRDGGTSEYVRDNIYLVSTNDSGVRQPYLYVDQYIEWDQVKGGLFHSEMNYRGTYVKEYYAPGKYLPSDWSKIPESLREEVAAHLHGETKRYVMHEYTLGTWEAEGDPPNGNTEPDGAHPFHPFDSNFVYVDNSDTAENKEKFLCDDDNRIGWRHTMYNIESGIIIIKYEVIAALPLDP